MAQRKCWRCAEIIQAEALVCPFCQANQKLGGNAYPKPSSGNGKWIALAIGVVVLALVARGAFVQSRAGNTVPAVDEAAGADTPTPLAVETLAVRKLKAGLKDPDSATTRNIFVPKGKGYACGEVNSKNGFGGMTGFKRFIAGAAAEMPVAIEGETMTPAEFGPSWARMCK